MKRRTRYLFIGLGAVFFLIAAPLVVFYVGGIRYNFGDNAYDKTGILSVETDPRKATVTLDEQRSETAPIDFRFLDPKEYLVTITKDGYFDWSKRLEIKPGKATIAAGFLNKIYLLKKSAPEVISDQVIDYYLDDSVLVYLTPTSVNIINPGNQAQPQSIKLAPQFNKLQASAQGSYLLLINDQQIMLLDVASVRLVDVTALLAKTTNWQITDNGTVLALRQGTLVSIDPATKQEVPLLPQVKSFTTLGTNLYYTQATGQRIILAVTPLATAAEALPQILNESVPVDVANGQLLITAQKDVVIWAINALFKVNTQLDVIAEGVTEVYFDAPSGTLVYSTASELSWYEFLANKPHLITRNTQAITSPQLATSIGYAFYMQNNSVQAMELDDRDHQNNYLLAPVTTGSSLRLDKKAENLYFLEGQTLKSLRIR
jgi:hypothetical protein